MLNTMKNNWWMLVLRGFFAVIFGVLAIFLPSITLAVLVLMFGAFVFIDGAFNIYAALNGTQHHRWWIGLLEGAVGIVTGILTFLIPGITGLILLYLIAFWAIMTGALELAAAVELRKVIENEWWLALSGVLSIAFGALLMISPASGALAVSWLIGLYAILFGGTMIALGAKLRHDPNEANSVYESQQQINEGNLA